MMSTHSDQTNGSMTARAQRYRMPDERTWALWVDWCDVVDCDPWRPDAVSLQRFFDTLPVSRSTADRRRAILRTRLRHAPDPLTADQFRQLGLIHAVQRSGVPAWRRGPGWLELGPCLSRIPAGGWPAGLRGRRDAFAALLVAEGPLTRSQAVTFNPRHLQVSASGTVVITAPTPAPPRSDGIDTGELRLHDDPLQCPRCVVVRWLEVCEASILWGRGRVHELLHDAPHAPISHACRVTGPAIANARYWRQAAWLLPAIDRHGWMQLEDYHTGQGPMSTRSLSAVLALRQSIDAAGPVLEPTTEPTAGAGLKIPEPGPWADVDDDELFEALEHSTAAADEVLQRVEQALKQSGLT